jgi:eukaryotic-like serine/threonine-protein kinase
MIGQKLGSYRIEAELGSGAMGVVYRGFNEVKNKPAAIKVISLEQMGKGKAMERFSRESDILEHFKHPNIVRYLARGRSGGKYYYAMEYIKGPTLEKVLRDRGSIPWREVAALGIQLCEALQYSHDNGVVHRDLKPSNLMLTETGQLKLTDFGIAKDLDGTALTGTGRTLGTATYMAPEQIRGTPEISHKTDLYGLGAVFYHLLTGVPPFSGSTALVMMHAHINEPPKRPSDKVEEMPKAFDDLVLALMAKEPKDRPWDAEAVAQILRDLMDKASRQATIKMVWPEKGSPESMPTRADMIDPTLVKKRKTKGSKKKEAEKTPRERLEVIGMVAALVVVASLIGYVVWPPSAAYLYSKAEPLMNSSDPLEWITAREQYIDPLDQRFPQHPYHEKTEAWRDKIDFREAERRAKMLEQLNLTGISNPKTDAEAYYQNTFKEAEAASKRKDDRDAMSLWLAMGKHLTTEGRENRGWVLVARSKAEALEKILQLRRKTVADLMTKSIVPPQFATSELAQKNSREILRDVVARFGDYTDVADLVTHAKEILAADEKKAEEPSKEPAPKS